MAGGNWDHYQHLNPNNGRVEWPTGPTGTLDPGYEPGWVDAWVVQGDILPGIPLPGVYLPGPSQSSRGSGPGAFASNQWTAATPGWKNGNLAPGPALGIALIAMYNENGGYEFDWWFKTVILR
jgi:hypothetical protein